MFYFVVFTIISILLIYIIPRKKTLNCLLLCWFQKIFLNLLELDLCLSCSYMRMFQCFSNLVFYMVLLIVGLCYTEQHYVSIFFTWLWSVRIHVFRHTSPKISGFKLRQRINTKPNTFGVLLDVSSKNETKAEKWHFF